MTVKGCSRFIEVVVMSYTKYRQGFLEYLQIEKNASPYTIKYYMKDIETFMAFLNKEAVLNLQEVDQQTVRLFLTLLYDRKLSRRSRSEERRVGKECRSREAMYT